MSKLHKYIGWTKDDPTPRHIVGGEFSGWRYTDCVTHHTCPKCAAEPGYHCITPKRRNAWPPHGERQALLPRWVGLYGATTEQESIERAQRNPLRLVNGLVLRQEGEGGTTE